MNQQYKQLVEKILSTGTPQKGRNGNTLIIPSHSFTVDFRTESPLLMLRKMHIKGIEGEFLTLVDEKPLTNKKQFEDKGCNYWKKWSGPNGSLNLDYYNELHPALERVINQIKEEPYSRRHVISLWNNEHAFDGSLSLHSCWHNLTFSVVGEELHMVWTQRSVDTMIGLPSDVMLAYYFMNYVSDETGYPIATCMFSLANVHIYEAHIDGAKELLTRSVNDSDKAIKFELF